MPKKIKKYDPVTNTEEVGLLETNEVADTFFYDVYRKTSAERDSFTVNGQNAIDFITETDGGPVLTGVSYDTTYDALKFTSMLRYINFRPVQMYVFPDKTYGIWIRLALMPGSTDDTRLSVYFLDDAGATIGGPDFGNLYVTGVAKDFFFTFRPPDGAKQIYASLYNHSNPGLLFYGLSIKSLAQSLDSHTRPAPVAIGGRIGMFIAYHTSLTATDSGRVYMLKFDVAMSGYYSEVVKSYELPISSGYTSQADNSLKQVMPISSLQQRYGGNIIQDFEVDVTWNESMNGWVAFLRRTVGTEARTVRINIRKTGYEVIDPTYAYEIPPGVAPNPAKFYQVLAHDHDNKYPVVTGGVFMPVVRGLAEAGTWTPNTNNSGQWIKTTIPGTSWYKVDLHFRIHGELSNLTDPGDLHLLMGFSSYVSLPTLPLNANADLRCGNYVMYQGAELGDIYLPNNTANYGGLPIGQMAGNYVYTESVSGLYYYYGIASWIVFA